MTDRVIRSRALAALAVCLVLALGGQAVADALVPSASGAATDAAVGRAASSYLTGLRSYVAAAMWNRIDPLLHRYYDGVALDDQRYMLSTIAIVEWLDPHTVRAFSLGAWLLVRNDRVQQGIAMAEDGLKNNPNDAIAFASLAQILWLYGDKQQAYDVAERAMGDEVVWPGPNESYSWLAMLHDMFEKQGNQTLAAEATSRMKYLEEKHGSSLGASDEAGE